MPRFLTIVHHDENDQPTEPPSAELQAKMGALYEEATKAGVMLDTAGLAPTAQGTRLSWADGKLSYTDGPFTESKEVIGGYSIVQAKDKAEALEWTRRFLEIQGQVEATIICEVREIKEF